MGLFDDILGGLGWIWDNTIGAVGDALWDQIVGGLVGWVVDAIAWFVKAVLRFFERSTTPDLTSNWFSGEGRIGPHAHSPYGVIAWLSLSLLLICVLIGLVQGLIAGEGPAMAGRIARDVPLAILGIVATIGVTQVLLGATDELSHIVLDNTQAGANAKALLEHLAAPAAFNAQASFVVFLLGLVAVIGSFLLWIELLIRASLIYLLLAVSPLAYAAFVWPAARSMLRKLAELVVALVLSKLVISIALAIAASAMTKGPSAAGGVPTGEQKVGTLLVGVIMFLLASFAPFLLLKLLPVVEAAVVAQGMYAWTLAYCAERVGDIVLRRAPGRRRRRRWWRGRRGCGWGIWGQRCAGCRGEHRTRPVPDPPARRPASGGGGGGTSPPVRGSSTARRSLDLGGSPPPRKEDES